MRLNVATMNVPRESPPATRRDFLKTSALAGAALLGPTVLPGRLLATPNAETLKVGLIGCGGRGTGAAVNALKADSNVVLTAMADVFPDHLERSLNSLRDQSDIADKVKVPPENRFIGFDAYQKVIDSGVDVVLLATPPGFRPAHLRAAVAAGKHVFTEKPMAVDATGVRSVLAAAAEARQKKLSLVAGFCYRYDFAVREFMQRIHEGAVGDIRAIHANFNVGGLWCHPRRPDWTDMEYQMRNWYYFTWLSGDHIVEQAVHSVDKMSWAMKDVPPVSCVALGGRQARTGPEFGHIYDHFAVVYEYANGVRGFLFCRQQPNTAMDNSDYIMGSKGTGRIVNAFTGPYVIRGETQWRYRGPKKTDMYQNELDEFFASIRSGNPINDGQWMAQSTLMAIMGRMAAYTGQVVTWDDAMNSKENLLPEKLAWDTPLAEPPVAIPGQTKLL